jgi:Flp pilus assembly pilin Flp
MPKRSPTRLLLRILADRRGVSAVEYAVLAVGVVVAVGSGVVMLGDPVNGAFAMVGTNLTQAISSMAAGGAR